ncbi:hypothetical protein J1N35_003788 [Gossypium stocksii]|uniref:Non-haem dioxygenase N-terminal domain-containing protein n=1 Tax=Gossypium stocksii TaxID=47602 RepID=A0A9D3WBK0_9ROSI|nr:hypothetical protein J1N35_003788 [Gossypium stocksii]
MPPHTFISIKPSAHSKEVPRQLTYIFHQMAPSFDNETSLFNFAVRDGNGIKGIVDSGISKVPQQYIQPPTERINKKNASVCKIPPIDLSKLDGPEYDEVANQIVRAAETLGFFQVINHGVPVELLESLKQTAHNFFALPPERKVVYRKQVSPSPLVKYQVWDEFCT